MSKRIALLLVSLMATALVACGGESEKKSGEPAPQAEGVSTEQASREYTAAADELQSSLGKYSRRLEEDADAGNVEAIKSDASGLRDSFYRFDGKVREISFPPAVQGDVNRVLEANRTVIGDLDAFAAATSSNEQARLLKRFSEDVKKAGNVVGQLVRRLDRGG